MSHLSSLAQIIMAMAYLANAASAQLCHPTERGHVMLAHGERVDPEDYDKVRGVTFIRDEDEGPTKGRNSNDDSDLRQLAKMTELKSVGMDGTQATNDGVVASLKDLKQIESFCARGTKLGDPALRGLISSKGLQDLRIGETQVTAKEIEYIAQHFKELRILEVSDLKLDDASIQPLTKLRKLTELYLNHTDVTDSCIPVIGSMKGLKTVALYRTQVTEQGGAKLQELLPDAQIYIWER